MVEFSPPFIIAGDEVRISLIKLLKKHSAEGQNEHRTAHFFMLRDQIWAHYGITI